MERENNLYALRAIATIMVVIIHVSGAYIKTNTGLFFNSISRDAVPIFVMLSGAFILDSPNTYRFKEFYKKSVYKIFLPTIFWSIIYVLYSEILALGSHLLGNGTVNYMDPIRSWLKGEPYYHLWYMYMIMGLYLVSPLLYRMKEAIGENRTLKVGIALLFVGIFTSYTCTLSWPTKFIDYIGYFILGYSFRKYSKDFKAQSFIYMFAGVIFLLLIFFLNKKHIIEVGYNSLNLDENIPFSGNLNPIVVISSLCLFIGFLNLQLNSSILNVISMHSFNIYLIHAGVLTIIDLFVGKFSGYSFNPIWYIPITTYIVLLVSFLFSFIIETKCKSE